jgi:cytochrome c553
MSTVSHQQEKQSHHRIRALLFALIVIAIAMMVAAVLFLPSRPTDVTASDSSYFQTASMVLTDGEEVFNRVCATCHDMDRSEDAEEEPIAPPMRMIARRYAMMTESAEMATARIVEWLEGPDAEKSLMPPMAIEHHGLMPPVVLTEEERSAVAAFVVALNDDATQGMQHGEGMQHGRGKKHQGH